MNSCLEASFLGSALFASCFGADFTSFFGSLAAGLVAGLEFHAPLIFEISDSSIVDIWLLYEIPTSFAFSIISLLATFNSFANSYTRVFDIVSPSYSFISLNPFIFSRLFVNPRSSIKTIERLLPIAKDNSSVSNC